MTEQDTKSRDHCRYAELGGGYFEVFTLPVLAIMWSHGCTAEIKTLPPLLIIFGQNINRDIIGVNSASSYLNKVKTLLYFRTIDIVVPSGILTTVGLNATIY